MDNMNIIKPGSCYGNVCAKPSGSRSCPCPPQYSPVPGSPGPQGVPGPAGATGAAGEAGPAGTVTPAAPVTDATNTTDVVTQFNQLLANMRDAGLLST